MHSFLNDVRFAFRVFRRNPGVSLVIVATLALGIAANSTMYSAFDAWILRPLAFDEPERLVALPEIQTKTGDRDFSVAPANYLDWRQRNTTFEDLGAFNRSALNLETDDEPRRIDSARVTASLFPLLGAEAALGRTFTTEEDHPSSSPVALLSDDLWRQHFDADPAILGRTVELDGRSHAIVGVMPPGFNFPDWAKVWTPLALAEGEESRGSRALTVIGRLKPGVAATAGASDLAAVAAQLEREFPETNEGWTVATRPLRDQWVPPAVKVALGASLACAAFVLLIICANVASLMLAQATHRQRETALRTALGAGRGRLLRQALTESTLLALAAGGLGLLGGTWLMDWMVSWAPVEVPYLFRFQMDGSALGYTLGVSLAAGLLCGLAPVFRSSALNVSQTLKGGGRSASAPAGQRLRSWLVAGQYAASVLLVIGALLMARSVLQQQEVDPGYRTDGVLTARLSMTGEDFKGPRSRYLFLEDALQGLGGISGVEATGAVSHLPASHHGWVEKRVEAEGSSRLADEAPWTSYAAATRGYLETLEIPLTEGRPFTVEEVQEGAPVAVVSAGLARTLWPEGNALAGRIRTLGEEAGPWLRVVGVVADVNRGSEAMVATNQPTIQLYVPYGLDPVPFVTLTLRSAGAPLGLADQLRREVRRAGPGVAMSDVMTLERAIYRVQWVSLYFTKLFALYAFVALTIAALGAYGVTADAVSRRRREMGIRRALGALPGDLLRQVVGRGVALAGAGVALGLLAAVLVNGVLSSLLYQVSARDPLVYGTVAVLLTAIAAFASYLPARRVARIDPMEVLRFE